MGACASIHHKASTVKVQSFDSTIKPENTSAIHPSPGTGKLPAMDDQHVAVKPQFPPSPSQYGSREETFFDTQAWLDSDYEDEFMSVNGDFTPSRGNTPVHPSSTLGTQRLKVGAAFMDHNEPVGSTSQPSPTPTEKRRRLLDLFKESVRDNLESNSETTKPSNKDGEVGSNKYGPKPKSESHGGPRHGCFKSLLSVRGSGKHRSPNPIVG